MGGCTLTEEQKKLTGRGGPGRGQGRKPLPPGEKMEMYMVTLPAEVAEQIRQLGEGRSDRDGNLSEGIRKLLEWYQAGQR